MMNLTFGIMTTYENVPQLNEVIASIKALNIPRVEIIVAGSYSNNNAWTKVDSGVQHVFTDGWTPVKKNLVAKVAYYENLVLLHDYFLFNPDWYRAYEKFGDQWDVCSNPQFLIDGSRHATDWTTWDSPVYPRYFSLPHDDWTHTKHQYISGQFFLVKRDFLSHYPFNESMRPGSPEDVEWSLRIRDTAVIKCNPAAVVRHNKKHRDVGNFVFPLYARTA